MSTENELSDEELQLYGFAFGKFSAHQAWWYRERKRWLKAKGENAMSKVKYLVLGTVTNLRNRDEMEYPQREIGEFFDHGQASAYFDQLLEQTWPRSFKADHAPLTKAELRPGEAFDQWHEVAPKGAMLRHSRFFVWTEGDKACGHVELYELPQ